MSLSSTPHHRPGLARLAALFALALAPAWVGCVQPTSEVCSATLICPPGYLCTANKTECRKEEVPCGNGELDVGEECDDGNITSGDGCNADCTSTEVCGNGFRDLLQADGGTEECDDGNTVSGDGCSEDCQSREICGNGRVDQGEQCDELGLSTDTCRSDCKEKKCGNGREGAWAEETYWSDGGVRERCDDGNLLDGDGCSSQCRLERCGDKVLDAKLVDGGTLEECDDGNQVDGDGCSSFCRREVCGNGIIDGKLADGGFEVCDNGPYDTWNIADGGTASGDGCSADCRSNETCGNGYWDPVLQDGGSEQCDDGNLDAGDKCGRTCKFEECGNGILDDLYSDGGFKGYEQCDDGNRDAGDGCGAACWREECGNGYLDSVRSDGGFRDVEQCDDGNRDAGDGCGLSCWREECGNSVVDSVRSQGAFRGFEQCDDGNADGGDSCSALCWREQCGNGFLDVGNRSLGAATDGGMTGTEQCDDGNSVGGDGCSVNCQFEDCGNGIVDAVLPDGGTEQCDDGNRIAGDGCGATCWREECGNGILDSISSAGAATGVGGTTPYEQCDDGNTLPGDGCGPTCHREECGNGIVDLVNSDGGFRGYEQCDDGNQVPGDDCGATCWREECGNGLVDAVKSAGGFTKVDGGIPFEQCDDGNRVMGDGCGASCWKEECGNGIVDSVSADGGYSRDGGRPFEQCDDGNQNPGDGCGTSCWREECGNTIADLTYSDGGYSRDGGRTFEQCDDGNQVPGDGCGASCWREECGNTIADVIYSDGGYNRDGGVTFEQCDDGNQNPGDGCGTSCWREECGNTIRDVFYSDGGYNRDGGRTFEQCDDGNQVPGDGCGATCWREECGNTIADVIYSDGGYNRDGGVTFEQCDDGNQNPGDGCGMTCWREECGNTIRDVFYSDGGYNRDGGLPFEQCDDGETVAGDGCGASCWREECGNTIADVIYSDGGYSRDGGVTFEQCDDGNQNPGDGCGMTCWREECGNTIRDVFYSDGGYNRDGGLPFEQCDDGDTVAGDGCGASCWREECGNNIADVIYSDGGYNRDGGVTFEQCDDGNQNPGDGCGTSCWREECGNTIRDVFYSDGGYSRDGGVTFEQCDDGNQAPGDGCGMSCWREECGNTIVDGVWSDGGNLGYEQCDDGNLVPGDRLLPDGGSCGFSCWFEECGNGIVDSQFSVGGYTRVSGGLPFEQCDDGNRDAGDACGATCWREECGNSILDAVWSDGGNLGYEQCDDGNVIPGDRLLPGGESCGRSCWFEVCGNGVVDSVWSDGGFRDVEQCDDGNTAAGDTCSPMCWREECGNGYPDVFLVSQALPDGGTRQVQKEECDDGNTVRGDGCGVRTETVVVGTEVRTFDFTSCLQEVCGNGIRDVLPNGSLEVCDDGPHVQNRGFGAGSTRGGDGCSATCSSLEVCGDGEVNPLLPDGGFEQCDPPSIGGGCGPTCKLEGCGNGVVDTFEFTFAAGVFDGGMGTRADGGSFVSTNGGRTRDLENCDDFNATGGDGCSVLCQKEECGNGYVDIDLLPDGGVREECDDGNVSASSNAGFTATPIPLVRDGNGKIVSGGCGPSCRWEECGNGLIDPGEQCDDGNLVIGDGCGATCWREECGNGRVDTLNSLGATQGTEQCDDGNKVAGDGCGPTCWREECGNGLVDPTNALGAHQSTEQCDDGNTTPGDGCGATCWREECGNGLVDAVNSNGAHQGTEQCDDGNLAAGDNCGATCWREECGNGLVDGVKSDGGYSRDGGAPFEQCDDGNLTVGDGCGASCWREECGNTINDVVYSDGGYTRTVGGLPYEQCDDGNQATGDGCGASCWKEECGNSILDAVWSDGGHLSVEQCDDGNLVSGDKLLDGGASCGSTCWFEVCGNGIVDAVYSDGGNLGYEQCDDGNVTPGDRLLPGGGSCGASCWFEVCGNGIVDSVWSDGGHLSFEQCDDGNLVAGDSCGAKCWREECGNGLVDAVKSDGGFSTDGGDPLEQCDDGNRTGGDGCGPACWREECGNGYWDNYQIAGPGGVQVPAEECDDGNKVAGDGCGSRLDPQLGLVATCLQERCGNGVIDAVLPDGGFEVCDNGPYGLASLALGGQNRPDGDPVSGDGCSADCRSNEMCGNGYHDQVLVLRNNRLVPKEACDPPGFGQDAGNTVSGDGCRADCLSDETCGNGELDTYSFTFDASVFAGGNLTRAKENCDDGNTTPGDGCSAICQTEVCGNGYVDLTYPDGGSREQCDDGDTSGTGGGPKSFRQADGLYYSALVGGAQLQPGCGPTCQYEYCGNGVRDPNEQCDDGNTVNTDGCDNECNGTSCGDGTVDATEQCDNGPGALSAENLSGDTYTCNGINANGLNNYDGSPGNLADGAKCKYTVCGDGYVNKGISPSNGLAVEACDPGLGMVGQNSVTCTSICKVSTCGDAFVNPVAKEQCDPGIADLFYCNGPGGLTTALADGGTAGCKVARCGDNYVNTAAGEECEPPNAPSQFGAVGYCSSTCQVLPCGNGTVDPGEACDDGNILACGTCNETCTAAQTPAVALGSITAATYSTAYEGAVLTIDDGIAASPYVFEFDTSGNGVTAGRNAITLLSTDNTAQKVGNKISTAINATSIRITAAGSTAAGLVNLSHDAAGVHGNKSVTIVRGAATALPAAVVVSGMSGGTGRNCDANTECESDNDCRFGSTCVGNTANGSGICDGPPPPPTNVVAEVTTSTELLDRKIRVSWSAAAGYLGSAVIGYTASAEEAGGTVVSCTATPPATSCVIGDVTPLVNGTAYTVTVTADNVRGTSEPSTAITNVIPFGKPLATTGVAAATGMNASTKVTWSANDGNGRTVTKYVATVTDLPRANVAAATVGTCQWLSGPLECTVSPLVNGTTYYVTVTAENPAGVGTVSSEVSFTPYRVPDAPTVVSAPSGANTQVTVTWSAPTNNGGEAIDSYTAYATAGAVTKSCPGAANATSCTITGLTNGTSYTITVTATNAAGEGAAGTLGSTAKPYTTPGAVTNLTGTAGDTQVSLTWTAPSADGGSPVTDYLVYFGTNAAGPWTLFNDGVASTTPAATVTGLTNGVAYYFRVLPVNLAGNGTEAITASSSTPLVKAPPPDTTTATSGENGQSTLTWKQTAGNGGSAITSFVVYRSTTGISGAYSAVNPGGSPAILPTPDANGVYSHVVTGLSNGTTYHFKLSVVNAAGEGNPGAGFPSPSGIKPYTVPAAPQAPTQVGLTGDRTATIQWVNGDNGGDAITSYTVQASTNGGTTWTTLNTTSTTPRLAALPSTTLGGATGSVGSVTINLMTNGTATLFKVKAINAAGASAAFSTASAGITADVAPTAPTWDTAVAGAGSATLGWNAAGVNGGSAIASYKVYYKEAAAGTYTEVGAEQPTAVTTLTRASVLTRSGVVVGGLANGTTYTFKISAVNSTGLEGPQSTDSVNVVPYTVPAKPVTTPLGTRGDRQVSLSWTNGDTGGSGITGYKVEYSSNSGTTWTSFADPTANANIPVTVTGLTNGTSYLFRITPRNAAGYGTVSDNSAAVSPDVAPAAPTSVSGAFGNAKVTLSWTAPAANFSTAVTNYKVYYQKDGAGGFVEVGSEGTNVTTLNRASATSTSGVEVGNLVNGSSYEFTVSAVNSATPVGMEGAQSTASAAVIPYTVPGKPGTPTETLGDRQVSLNWTDDGGTGGNAITGYKVEYKAGAGSWTTFADPTANTNKPVVVTGLTNGTSYTFRVTAKNAAGYGAVSDASTGVIPDVAPAAPTAVTGVHGNAKVTLSWTAPAGAPTNYSTALTNYRVFYEKDSGAWVEVNSEASNKTTLVRASATSTSGVEVGNLVNGSSYRFKVSAVNSSSMEGAQSAASAAIVPKTLPTPPVISTVTAGGGSGELAVSWAALTINAETGGSAITGYYATASAGAETRRCPASGTTLATTCTITGMTNGTTYSVTVTAENSEGSNTSTASTGIPFTNPDAPSITAQTPGNQQVSLTWSAPSGNGRNIKDYLVQYRVGPSGSFTDIPGGRIAAPTATATLTGLTNGQDYYFQVQARNVGTPELDSAFSPVGTAVIPRTTPQPPVLQSAPSSTASVIADKQIVVTWDEVPVNDNGGNAVNRYEATARDQVTNDEFTCEVTSAPWTTCTITGLTNGKLYTVSVVAENEAGSSGSSNSLTNVKPDRLPVAPPAPTLAAGRDSFSNDIATASWTATLPSYDGSNVLDFDVEFSTSSTGNEPPSARRSAAMAGGAATAVLFGGESATGQFLADTWTSNGLTWTLQTPATSPSPRKGHAMAEVGGTVYLFGGTVEGPAYANDVWAWNGTSWSSVGNSSIGQWPSPRTGHALAPHPTLPNHLVLFGGRDASGPGGSDVELADTWEFDTVGGTWAPTTPAVSPPARSATAMAKVGSQVILFGGKDSSGNALGDLWIYEPKDVTVPPDGMLDPAWTEIAPPVTTPDARFDHAMAVEPVTGNVLLMGGQTGTGAGATYMGGTWLYIPGTNSWTNPASGVVPAGRSGIALASITSGSLMFGGADGSATYRSSRQFSGTKWHLRSDVKNVQVSSGVSTTFKGQEVGIFHYARVRAHNQLGWGPYSAVSDGVKAGTPKPPTSVSGTANQDSQVTLAILTAQQDTGILDDIYTVESSSDDFATTTTHITNLAPPGPGPSNFTYTATGLVNGTTYKFRVAAENGDGKSAWTVSAPIAPNVLPDKPGTPTLDMAASGSGYPGSGQVALTWTAPTPNGGSAVTDYKVEYSSNAGTSWTEVSHAASSSSTITVTGLTNGTAYVFRVTAINAGGAGTQASDASAQLTPRTVPGAPTLVSAPSGANAQVVATWTAPASDGGSAITGYTATATAGASTQSCSAGAAATFCTISGLSNGTAYTVTVKATNAAGDGDASNALTATPYTTPGAPSNVQGAAGNVQVALSWDAPASNGGSAITDYNVYRGTTATGPWTQFVDGTSTNLFVTVTGLTNGTTYYFKVTAVNAKGEGAEVVSSSFTPRTVPDAPTNLQGNPGNAQVTVSWNAPANGGSVISDYKIEYSSNSGTSWTLFSDGVSASTNATVTGLLNGTGYIFRVHAENEAGAGGDSGASPTVTPRTFPGAPTSVVATAGNASASLTWTAPTDNGGESIDDYVVEFSKDGGAWTNFNDGVSTNASASVTGLVNGSSYTFRVRALNDANIATPANGNSSTSSNAVTPNVVPDAPGTPTGTPGNASVTLSWTAPVANGGTAVTDYVIDYSSNSGGSWTTFPDGTSTNLSATVTGLANGINHVFRVRAVNALGAGANSPNSAFIAPRTVPGAPGQPSGTAGNTQVVLTWSAPTDTGGASITDYVVEYSSNAGVNWTVFTDAVTATTGATVTGLTNGGSYLFRVAAKNVAGTGSTSSNSATVKPGTTPGAPTITSGDPTDSVGSAHIVWSAPLSDGGDPITDYVIQYSTVVGFTGPVTVNNTTSTTLEDTVTGLSTAAAGQDYYFKVAAINSFGTGTYSATFGPIKASVPTLPRDVSGSGRTQNRANMWWSAPAFTGGRTIVGYSLQISWDAGAVWNNAAPITFASAPTFSSPLALTTSLFTSDTIRMRAATRYDVGGTTFVGTYTTVFNCNVSGDNGDNPAVGHDRDDFCATDTGTAAPSGSLKLVN